MLRFEWKDQAIFGLITFGLAVWINRLSSRYTGTLLLVVLSLFSTGRYAYWRYSETYRQLSAIGLVNLSWDVVFPLMLLLAESYAILVLALGYFQSLRPLDRYPTPLPRDLDQWPMWMSMCPRTTSRWMWSCQPSWPRCGWTGRRRR